MRGFNSHPFREVVVSKDPKLSLERAIQCDKTRTLSIATIKDVIVQRLIYQIIEPYSETKFQELGQISYAYRKNSSAPAAAREVYKCVKDGYCYVLDADLSKFFDTIPHEKLNVEINEFFGPHNLIINTYLRRFYSTDKVEWASYEGDVRRFYKEKPERKRRECGIPQGGVLSGLLANMYMHQFDKWVCEEIKSVYDCKYIRYADDFVFLFKTAEHVEDVYELCSAKCDSIGLTLHPLGGKSQILNLTSRQSLEFVGFEINPKSIKVRNANVAKFKQRINKILEETPIHEDTLQRNLTSMIRKISFKVIGNEAFEEFTCEICGMQKRKRSWLSYFMSSTDVRQLRAIDIWIRRRIHEEVYFKTRKMMPKNYLNTLGIPSLEKKYYQYHKELGHIEFCQCD